MSGIISKEVMKGSTEYERSLDLRYHAMYDSLNRPKTYITDEREAACKHFVGMVDEKVIACARLYLFSQSAAELSEIVINVGGEQEKAGSRSMFETIFETCRTFNIQCLFLYAPREYIGFYQEMDFVSSGFEFLSKRTDTYYHSMQKQLMPKEE